MKIHNLLEKAVKRRNSLSNITDAMRLVNGEADGLEGITVDRYNRHFVIQKFISKPEADINIIKDFITEEFNPEYIILKERKIFSQGNTGSFTAKVLAGEAGPHTVITENNLKFLVGLNDNVNVGLFLDMRGNRKIVSSLCENKSVLNCFAYTCSFGVYCCSNKALKVVNVDINKKALEKGKENYRLNNLPATEKDFIKRDCMDYMQGAVRTDNMFDIIIMDGPTFSRYNGKVFLINKELPKLIELSMRILKPGGHLFVSSNFSGISIPMLRDFVKKGVSSTGISTEKITQLGQDIDFPKSNTMKESYLAALLLDFK